MDAISTSNSTKALYSLCGQSSELNIEPAGSGLGAIGCLDVISKELSDPCLWSTNQGPWACVPGSGWCSLASQPAHSVSNKLYTSAGIHSSIVHFQCASFLQHLRSAWLFSSAVYRSLARADTAEKDVDSFVDHSTHERCTAGDRRMPWGCDIVDKFLQRPS